MGIFSSKEKIPEIPPAPRLPDIPELPRAPKSSVHELPTLPSNEFGKSLNQEMVKSAVSDPGKEEEVLPNLPQDHFSKNHGMIPSLPRIQSTAAEVHQEEHEDPFEPNNKPVERKTLEITPQTKTFEEPITKSTDPIFVKIANFQEAQGDFKDITKKINAIEKTLRKIQQEKVKEDKELGEWVEDIEKAKAKLSEIDSDIFNKL